MKRCFTVARTVQPVCTGADVSVRRGMMRTISRLSAWPEVGRGAVRLIEALTRLVSPGCSVNARRLEAHACTGRGKIGNLDGLVRTIRYG